MISVNCWGPWSVMYERLWDCWVTDVWHRHQAVSSPALYSSSRTRHLMTDINQPATHDHSQARAFHQRNIFLETSEKSPYDCWLLYKEFKEFFLLQLKMFVVWKTTRQFHWDANCGSIGIAVQCQLTVVWRVVGAGPHNIELLTIISSYLSALSSI